MSSPEPASDGAELLRSSVRRRIVECLLSLPRLAVEGRPTRDVGLTAAELGEMLGLHSTTVRFHLDQLEGAGLVESHFVRGGGAGRPKKKYVAAEGDLEGALRPGGEGPFQVLAGLLAEALDPAEEGVLSPEEAGVRWVQGRLAARGGADPAAEATTTGQWLGKVGGVVDLLEEWGYAPDLTVGGDDGDVVLTLRECPFIDLARVRPAVVCGVHRGLLKGALEATGESQAGVSLRPFVDPSTCHAVLVRDGDQEGGLLLPGGASGTGAS